VSVLRDDDTYSLEHGYQDRYGNGFLDEFAAIMERDGGGFIRDLGDRPAGHTRLRSSPKRPSPRIGSRTWKVASDRSWST
jgi:hypothetical protein